MKHKMMISSKAKSSINIKESISNSSLKLNCNKTNLFFTKNLSSKNFSIFKRKYKELSNTTNTLPSLKYNLDLINNEEDYLSDEISFKGKINLFIL